MTWPAVVDGELREDGRVPLLALSSGLQFGEGLFETLPMVDHSLIFFHRHLDRLEEGAAYLGFRGLPSRETWISDVRTLKRRLGMSDLSLRLLLIMDGEVLRRVVAATEAIATPHAAAAVGPVAAELNGPRSLSHLKSLNYLVPRRAHALGAAQGFDEVLFTGGRGQILEGTRTSVFAVLAGVLRTAPLSEGILAGVTRQVLLEAACALGIPSEERAFQEAELFTASEAFLTASLRGVRPIQSYRGVSLRGDGPVTVSLREAYQERARSPREIVSLGLS